MYAKKFRLPVEKNGFKPERQVSRGRFSLKFANNQKKHNRFAIIIPRGSVRKSSRRNFWKRAISDHIKNWPNLKKDFLILVRQGIDKLSKQQAYEELDSIFQQTVDL